MKYKDNYYYLRVDYPFHVEYSLFEVNYNTNRFNRTAHFRSNKFEKDRGGWDIFSSRGFFLVGDKNIKISILTYGEYVLEFL